MTNTITERELLRAAISNLKALLRGIEEVRGLAKATNLNDMPEMLVVQPYNKAANSLQKALREKEQLLEDFKEIEIETPLN